MSKSKRVRDSIHCVGNNMPDVIEYTAARRPDNLVSLQSIIAKDDPAINFLIAIAYAAGRASVVAELEKTTITNVVKDAGL